MTGPDAADVRAAHPEWEIVLSPDGYWSAWLTTAPKDEPAPRLTGATLAELAYELRAYIGGDGAQ